MGFADDLEVEDIDKRRTCALCDWLDTFDDADDVQAAFAAGRNRSAIWRALSKAGFPKSLAVVDRHYRAEHWRADG